ncbi:MAG: tRNA (adenosine(37)-N6)-threonylcarbamoyltransferase complex dimerization subunit type 1 TsaB [Oscillospiraceae bacterium]|nr:tRNA (adenosine(37)-N6)-threonylcarbamoyltransferase complex dimerization subunit type 1 TsaB [Oscillospiraceae bacterium]
MLILAFETTAKAGSVALLDEKKLLGESYQNTGLTHSQTLMVMAEDLLKQCGKSVSDVTAVAVAEGPGSFTGVRIGVAAAKGFAWGGELPCYGISTLEAMAETLGVYQGYVCPCMDARRSQVYNALFYVNCGKAERVREDRAIALSDLAEELKALEGPIFLVGDGSNLTYSTLSGEIPNLILPPEHRMHQRASGVALLAAKKIAAGEPGDGNALNPNYLRLSQAERERMEKMQNAKC